MSDKIQYYTLSDDHKTITPVASDIIVKPDGSKIYNPTVEQLNAYGRYTLKDEKPPVGKNQEAVKTGDYSIVDNVICVNYKVFTLVDTPPPEVDKDHEILRDYWEIEGDNYVHKYVVVELVDNPPEYDLEHQRLEDLGWHVSDDETQKIHDYRVLNVIDNGPQGELPPGYHWEKHEERTSETEITIVYEAVRNPVHVYSKYKIVCELGQRGVLDKFDEFMEHISPPTAGNTTAKRLWDEATRIRDDYSEFEKLFSGAYSSCGLTEEEGRAILAAALVEVL